MLECNITKEQIVHWVEFLESRRFHQGQRFLCGCDAMGNNKKYCCLGILCKSLGMRKRFDPLARCYDYGKGQDHYYGLLPPGVFYTTDGQLKRPVTWNQRVLFSLTEINDSKICFTDIACIIRIQWLEEDLPYPPGLKEATEKEIAEWKPSPDLVFHHLMSNGNKK